jgi:hypothetical protein
MLKRLIGGDNRVRNPLKRTMILILETSGRPAVFHENPAAEHWLCPRTPASSTMVRRRDHTSH